MNLKMQKGEDKYHFLWRVYKYHNEFSELSQEEAGEICRRELGEDYDESAFRKPLQYFFNVWDSVKHEYLSDDALLEQMDDIDSKMDDLYKQQVKTRDKLRESRKHLRDEARIENLVDVMYEIAESIEPISLGIDERDFGKKSAILRVSDWHTGKHIDNYWNEYNRDIQKERLDKLIFETVKYCEIFGIGELYISNLGDMIDGAIHGNARVANEEDVLEQVMRASELISYMLEAFVEYGLKINYLSVLDNHSRLNANYKEHIEKENFGKLIQWYVEARMKDKVQFVSNLIDDNIGFVEIDGKNHFFVHGHLKAHSVNTIVQNLALSLRCTVDYVHMGHWHSSQSKDYQFAKVFINGSMCGVDEYAANMGFFSLPAQSLIVVDGDTDIRLDIKLN